MLRSLWQLRKRIVSEIYDEKVDRSTVVDKEVKKPKTIDNLGYNHTEQVDNYKEYKIAFCLLSLNLMDPNQYPRCEAATKKDFNKNAA